MLRALRRLHETAFVQIDLRAANQQFSHEKRMQSRKMAPIL
jgi:hypothetical protein